MKVELKHLASYLPYKLKIKRGERNLVMNTGQGSSTHWVGISAVIKWYNSDMISKPIPILRPLSDITKPCLDGGLIPIVELVKITMGVDSIKVKKLEINKDGAFILFNDDFVFAYCIEKSFGMYDFNGKIYTPAFQLRLFEKLFEWHFDIYGLIEQGLAIDINTLD